MENLAPWLTAGFLAAERLWKFYRDWKAERRDDGGARQAEWVALLERQGHELDRLAKENQDLREWIARLEETVVELNDLLGDQRGNINGRT